MVNGVWSLLVALGAVIYANVSEDGSMRGATRRERWRSVPLLFAFYAFLTWVALAILTSDGLPSVVG